MKTYIDFSIFESPVRAYGNVTGYVELPTLPIIGDEILLFQSTLVETFSGSLRVISITPVELNGRDDVVVGLEDVVMNSKEAAIRLATQLVSECGLFFTEYETSRPESN